MIITILVFMLKAWTVSLMLTIAYGGLRYWIVGRVERKERDRRSMDFLKRGSNGS